MNFGITFGLLWCYFPAIVLCVLGAKQNRFFLQRLLAVLLLQIFLGSVTYWHGGVPGNRFLAPVLLIFIPEMVAGWRRMKEHLPRLTAISVILLTIISLPILEYRNTAVREYSESTFRTGEPVGYDENNEAFFDPSDLNLNPAVFATSILIAKLTNQQGSRYSLAGFEMNIDDIYPSTIGARMLYLATKEGDIGVVSPELHKVAVRFMPLFAALTGFLYGAILALVANAVIRRRSFL